MPVSQFQFNHISYTMSPIPLVSQRNMITPDMLCNSTTLSDIDCKHVECTCTHALQVKLNSVVELIINEGDTINFNHHVQLHGDFFRVAASEQLQSRVAVERVKRLDREGRIKRTLNRASIKDTMKVPYNEFTPVIRFYADNPGYWFFHCHFEPHPEWGIALVFKIGEDEDMIPVPKKFPKCGNYLPYM